MIDHVIGDVVIGQEVRPYPFFVQPLVTCSPGAKLHDPDRSVAVELVLLILLGAFGTGRGERDVLNTEMATGQDTATRTENDANCGFSWAGGLIGLDRVPLHDAADPEFNHHYRSQLYERLQTLPMTTFDDERIGDAVYRVMYDTPAITRVCYRC